MTEQEAMEIIMQVAYDGEFPNNSNEAFGIACECMRKQIPIKPTLIEDKMYMCPRCYNNLMFKWKQYPTVLNSRIGLRYCLGCGQKLDWEEVEE